MADLNAEEMEALTVVEAALRSRNITALEVLGALFPNALTRPLYSIEDMMRQAERYQPPSRAFPMSERKPLGRLADSIGS